eukprot:SAG25_NODE_13811_length_262_cov_1.263804_1_plen_47_part_01
MRRAAICQPRRLNKADACGTQGCPSDTHTDERAARLLCTQGHNKTLT